MQKTAQLCSAVLVALRHVMMYFTEGILSEQYDSQCTLQAHSNIESEGGFKAMVQGPAYKKALQSRLDRVKDLTTKIDQEAIVRSQHRLKDVEGHAISISKVLKELQASTRLPNIDEAWKQDVITQIGDYTAERVINSMLSQLSSSSCIDGGMTWS